MIKSLRIAKKAVNKKRLIIIIDLQVGDRDLMITEPSVITWVHHTEGLFLKILILS